MRKLLLGTCVVLAAFAVSGAACDPNTQKSPAEAALLGCQTVTAQLEILYPLRRDGKLPKWAVELIDKQRAISDPFCLGPAPDVNATVKDIAVDGVARSLTGLVAAF